MAVANVALAQPAAVDVALTVDRLPKEMLMRRLTLDAAAPSDDENLRLRPEAPVNIKPPHQEKVRFDPYGVKFWSFE